LSHEPNEAEGNKLLRLNLVDPQENRVVQGRPQDAVEIMHEDEEEELLFNMSELDVG
jgi:hypothetical protein